MGLTQKQLQLSHTVFHGIVPGKSARPIGKIYLETAFGNVENFRSKIIPFEVVDLESPYHAILGRSAYVRFMARPCYVYLKLKYRVLMAQSLWKEAGPGQQSATNSTSRLSTQHVPKKI